VDFEGLFQSFVAGKILCEMDGATEGIVTADLDLAKVVDVRTRMPVLEHRRADLYADPAAVPVHVVEPR
jgi:predicted amidohydrolase